MRATTIRRSGYALLAGATAWGASLLITGPLADDELSRLELAGSLAFQIGFACLISVLWATKATGAGRWGQAVLAVQSALVALAAGWTITHVAAKNPSMADEGILAALDSAWPLSMLWFLVVGITVARARRWPSALRRALLTASLWFAVAAVAYVAGDWPGVVVSALWLLGAYGVVGLLLVRDASSLAAGSESTLQPAA